MKWSNGLLIIATTFHPSTEFTARVSNLYIYLILAGKQMLRSACASLLLLHFTAAVAQETKSISRAESVLAIYASDWGLASSGRPKLITSVWGDGSIVWSNDTVNGGPPYFTARIKPEIVSGVFEEIINKGAFDVPRLEQANCGPDSKFTTILLRVGDKKLKMDSWHEQYESNGKFVALDHGITGLNDKRLLQALAEQPADYLHYRMAWLELRLAVTNLIPRSGKESSGAVAMHRGDLRWNASDDKFGTESGEKEKGDALDAPQ